MPCLGSVLSAVRERGLGLRLGLERPYVVREHQRTGLDVELARI
jgi:hypothetical protein